ncbi:MAG TPA: phosphatase PAP2 family protein, partial [Burkholderiaceae bacterium]|nr:phosphatase PAP2 family protein [Burkholderiaceae bacterium]
WNIACASESLQRLGDVLQYALPATGLAATAAYGDGRGTVQWFWSGATTLTFVGVGKALGEKTRPDESSANSYPSGHAAWAFWGASFLDSRYGPVWGIPAYALAALTAYSRVEADKHYPDDVLAGASIALLSNFFWVRPLARDITIEPVSTRGGAAGFAVRFFDAPVRTLEYNGRALGPTPWQFSYQVATTSTRRNIAAAPSASGTRIDVARLTSPADPMIASSFRLSRVEGSHDVSLLVAPFGTGAVASLTAPAGFAGAAFGALATDVDYRLYDYRLRYRRSFAPHESVTLRLGGALQAARTSIELSQPAAHGHASAWSVLPLVHAGAEWRVARDWLLALSGEAMALDSHRFGEADFHLQYRFSDGWNASLGIAERRSTVDTAALYNDLWQRAPYLAVEHRW